MSCIVFRASFTKRDSIEDGLDEYVYALTI